MDYRSVQIDPSANIAPDCSILGHVTIGPDVTVFSGAALRGDYGNDIVVGARSRAWRFLTARVPWAVPLV